jgi:hypothetical protein
MPIALDTSVLIGLLDSQGVCHTAAVSIQWAIIAARPELVDFNCVLADAISTISRRLWEKHRETEWPHVLDYRMADFRPETIT